MIFVQDITGRFLINVEKIDFIDHKPDGSWWVVVRNRQFEISEDTLSHLKAILEEEEDAEEEPMYTS